MSEEDSKEVVTEEAKTDPKEEETAEAGGEEEDEQTAPENNKVEGQCAPQRIRGGGKLFICTGGDDRKSRRDSPYGVSSRWTSLSGSSDDAGAAAASSSKNRRVYVGNLSWHVNWQELKDYFGTETGEEVLRADILTGPDGRSKGCGIVEFATEEGAQKAVLTVNDTEFQGRQIFVREDREDRATNTSSSSFAAGGGGGGGRFSSDSQSRRVYVGNLSWEVAWQDLKDHMRDAGEVVHAEVITEASGRSKGCGVVEYKTVEEAKQAIATLNDTELLGRMIFVREDREMASGPLPSRGGGRYGGGGGGGGGTGGTGVYVWNLSYDTSWQDLKDHARRAGNVDTATILTGSDGRSIGCGVIQYQHPKEAERAIRELQNSTLNGRPIRLRPDRGGPGSSGGGGGGYRGGGGAPRSSGGGSGCQVFITNLSYDTEWQGLKDHFRECGEVLRADVKEDHNGRKRGIGSVRFATPAEAQRAVNELNGVELDGRELMVRIDERA